MSPPRSLCRALPVCAALAFGISSAAEAFPQAFFSSHDNIQGHLVEAIDRSHRSIDVALFEFSATPLVEAIEHAAARGVFVRLLMDRGAKIPKIQKSSAALEVRYLGGRTQGGRGIMHNKFAVLDEQLIATGSFNWTSGAQYANYENLIFENDPDIVREFSGQFAELWNKAVRQPSGRNHQRKPHEKRSRRAHYFRFRTGAGRF